MIEGKNLPDADRTVAIIICLNREKKGLSRLVFITRCR
jgi:hypothetical protein